MITENQIREAQKEWGNGIVKIGTLKYNKEECIEFTKSFLNSLYDFKKYNLIE